MTDPFDKLLDFAVAKEDEAAAFYEFLASATDRESLREVFLDFSRHEKTHRTIFEKIITEGFKGKGGGAAYQPTDLHLSDYLVSVSFDPAMTYQDALILGMKQEEKSNRLYLDLARQAPDPELSKILVRLAEEEARHKQRLEEIYDQEVLTEG